MIRSAIEAETVQNTTEQQRIILVLGSVGSGLQLVCQTFESLGVDFFLQPQGEDTAFLAEMNNLLALMPDKNWRKTNEVLKELFSAEPYSKLQAAATEKVLIGLQNSNCLGLKISQPFEIIFWMRLLSDLHIDTLYVIQHRNPLSVAFSLAHKQAILPEKSHYLWLECLCAAFHFSHGRPRIVLDYDGLVDSAEGQIIKMIQLLGMHVEQLPVITENQFQIIRPALRHSLHTLYDVMAEPLAPMAVKRAVGLMDDILCGKIGWDAEEVAITLNELAEQAKEIVAGFIYTTDGCLQPSTPHTDSEPAEYIIKSQRNQYIGLLHQTIGQKDEVLAELGGLSEIQAAGIATMNQQIHGLDQQTKQLMKQIVDKNAALIQAHRKVVELEEYLKKAKGSSVWSVLNPFSRKNTMSLQADRYQVAAVPMHEVAPGATATEWLSVGEDTQFALVAGREWVSHFGWNWLEIEIYADQPLNGQIFFNLGQGYTPQLVLEVLLQGIGPQKVPIFIPKDCCSIRFDPCDIPVSFKLPPLRIWAIQGIPELPREFRCQFRVYEVLGARQGNITGFEPINSLVANGQGGYSWQSEGSDPWFLLTPPNEGLHVGWYQVEFCIHASVSKDNAKLYFNYGEGFSEAHALELPFYGGKIVKRLFSLSAAPVQIRFDPLECEARFSFQKLHFQSIAKESVNSLMLQHLQENDRKFKNKSVADIERCISRQAIKQNIAVNDLLWRQYNNTFIRNGTGGTLTYAEWIELNESAEFNDIETLQAKQNNISYKPVISVLMPVYNSDEFYLRSAIESVLKQSYPNWELCIADDASPNYRVREILAGYENLDPRIKVTYRAKNGHISAASNSALELATGDYVALLDHDDEFSEHALHFVVQAINQYPLASILYSDEDKIDGQGNRSEPHFKSDWNPDLFFSQNYVSHLGVYRRELLIRIGGFRLGVEGSQDQDLILRCLPLIKSDEVIHIPKILYHWRILEGSTALDAGEKTYTADAGIKALQDYFSGLDKTDVRIELGLVPNTYRVRYPVPEPQPLVSLIIPTRDMLNLLKPCVDSIIENTTYRNYEIIILDNGSLQADTLEYFEAVQARDKRIKVVPYDFPFNYSAINNYGATFAKGELIGLVNNDVEVISPDWLTEMVSHAIRPEIGCVGAKLYYDDDTIQHAGVIIGLGGVAGHSHKHFPRNASGYFHRLKIVQNLSSVTAACMVLRKSVFDEVGGLEEDGLKIAFNDVDFCLKVREAGYRNLWTPYAELYHYESKSRGYEDTADKIARFNSEIDFIKNKWGEHLHRDPFYSRNLTTAREDFSL